MKPMEWIVCEQTGRWAAALRTAAVRNVAFADLRIRLREVRTLNELTMRLSAASQCLVMIEVQRDLAGQVLVWLADAAREFRQARFVALLDYGWMASTQHTGRPLDDSKELIAHALAEAGAADAIDSPRRSHTLFELARRHAALMASDRSAEKLIEKSVVEAAWESLPWQDG